MVVGRGTGDQEKRTAGRGAHSQTKSLGQHSVYW